MNEVLLRRRFVHALTAAFLWMPASTVYAQPSQSESKSDPSHSGTIVSDPSTQEATIVLRVEMNPTSPKHGTVTFEVGDSKSVFAIDQEVTSLLTGETACSSSSIGEKPSLRPADSPMTLLEIESNQTPKIGFCLWLDQPVAQHAK